MDENPKKYRLEIYKEMHFNEVARKKEVDERAKWLLNMWILLLGIIVFCFQNYYKVEPYLKEVFFILMLYTITFTLLSGVLLAKCFAKKPYAHLQSPTTIENYLNSNQNDTIEDFLIESCGQTYDVNFKKNNSLISIILDCTQVMMVTYLLLFGCFLCLVPNWIEKEEPVQKIEIIERGETND